jgi:MIT (microtubule interacting and transport) domain
MEGPVGVSNSHTREHSGRREHERTESSSTSPQRSRRPGGSTQKATLSKALQKANTAVLLDNAANFEGAIEAYQDACELLQFVMVRSGGDVEKYKLQEIVGHP